MCMIDNADSCEWFGTIMRKARKTHKCEECNREINCGELYAYSSYAQDGKAYSNKACSHCHAAREWLSKHCNGWITGGLHEDLYEHWSDGYHEDGLSRLLVGMKNQWQKLRSDGLMPIPQIAA